MYDREFLNKIRGILSNFNTNFDNIADLDEIEQYYKDFDKFINKHDILVAHIGKQCSKFQYLNNSTIELETFKGYLNIFPKVFKDLPEQNAVYDIDFLQYFISNFDPPFITIAKTTRLHEKSLFMYILSLLTEVSDSWLEENDWKCIEKQSNVDIKITYAEFKNYVITRFKSQKNNIISKFENWYDYYAYKINQANLNKINGSTKYLFLYPVKTILLDLINVVDSAIGCEITENDNIKIILEKANLSPRDKEVFTIICNDIKKSNKEIADILNVSEKTVESCKTKIISEIKILFLDQEKEKTLSKIITNLVKQ